MAEKKDYNSPSQILIMPFSSRISVQNLFVITSLSQYTLQLSFAYELLPENWKTSRKLKFKVTKVSQHTQKIL